MQIIKYKCYLCKKFFEFLDQEVWEVIIPNGWSGKSISVNSTDEDFRESQKPHKLIIIKEHICLKCGVKLYENIMKLKKEENQK